MAKKKRTVGISGVAAFLNSARTEEVKVESHRFKRQKIEFAPTAGADKTESSDSDGPEEDSMHAPPRGGVEVGGSSGGSDSGAGADSGCEAHSDSGSGADSGSEADSSSSSSSSSDSSSDSESKTEAATETEDSTIYHTTLPPALPEEIESGSGSGSEAAEPEYIKEHPRSATAGYTRHTPYWPDYSTLPKSLSNYYNQRHFLFSKFDEGVLLNNAQWFSTTPELVAEQVAQHLWSRFPDPNLVVVDAFGGAGGNAIQLAHYYDHVICIDIEPESITCAKQNAWVYGVSEKIEFVVGDCLEVLARPEFQSITDIIFGSPPWGGPSYKSHGGKFDLFVMEPLELRTIHDAFFKVTDNVCYFLPKNSDLEQLQHVCGAITALVDVNTGKNPFASLWPVQQQWAKTVCREKLGLEVALKQTRAGDDVKEEDLGKSNEGVTLTYNYINGRLKGCMVYLGGLA
ncbi:YALIA101S04e12596g1_1 [Yarrowia lipolytica]|nr:Trimethylguanosine synthase [Yarrowia lipolytica]SEI34183.1 YALIA101S04e12596g1_1 [Yarrowia lipolytica]VBB88923.1 Conserved hypothetical protein [Yarrowia lipolytica]